jgi:dTDP-4-amino-4,6-dideoxygalactose transaminase
VMGVLLEKANRTGVRKALAERGIGTSMHYPPVHQFECYRDFAVPLPITEEIGRREISLPLYYSMSIADVDRVCDELVTCLEST